MTEGEGEGDDGVQLVKSADRDRVRHRVLVPRLRLEVISIGSKVSAAGLLQRIDDHRHRQVTACCLHLQGAGRLAVVEHPWRIGVARRALKGRPFVAKHRVKVSTWRRRGEAAAAQIQLDQSEERRVEGRKHPRSVEGLRTQLGGRHDVHTASTRYDTPLWFLGTCETVSQVLRHPSRRRAARLAIDATRQPTRVASATTPTHSADTRAAIRSCRRPSRAFWGPRARDWPLADD